jgi:hypothetical protein
MRYLSIIGFIFFLFACYGWGYALVRWTDTRDKHNFAFLSVVGIAVLIFLGGILNLVRLAYPAALIVLLVSGLAFFLISFSADAKMWLATWRAGRLINPARLKNISGYALPIGILVVAVGFYALTLLPVTAFNIYDDYFTYLPRPFRMLQTGTLAGSPYEVLGTDALGGQAFLQGFVLLGFPFEYLQGFEAVFSFGLAGWLLIEIGKKFNLHWIYTTLALLGFIVINPQSVNVSPIYLGSAFILGIMFASCQLLEQMEKSDSSAIPMMTVAILGLLLAGLLALKNTFLIFPLAYFALFFIGLLLISTDKRKILKIGGLIMLAAFLALLPWLGLHAANFVSTMRISLHHSAVTSSVGSFSFISLKGNLSGLFSTAKLYYGGSFLSYGIIVLMLALIGTYSLFKTIHNQVSTQRGYFLVAACSCTAGIISYLSWGLILAAAPPAVRYSCPVLIATLPFAWLAASMAIPNSSHPAKALNLSGMKMAAMLSMPLLVVILFWGNFVERVERAYYQHVTFSFTMWGNYVKFNDYAISPDAKQEIRDIQNKTQPGQKILVWISMPMHLDFARNQIYSIMGSSLLNPWLDMPFNGNADDMLRYLKGQGIRYVMLEDLGDLVDSYQRWQFSRFAGYRKMADRGLYMRHVLGSLTNSARILYNQNAIVLFDLQQEVK